jgi:hypothetical protein
LRPIVIRVYYVVDRRTGEERAVGMARRAGRFGGLVAAVVLGMVVAVVPAWAAGLPDGRGYELVSPPVKNGADVMASSRRVHVAADGNAVTFGSLGGFGEVQGAGVGFDYMARRTGTAGTNGWVTHPLDPRQPSLTLLSILHGADSNFMGEFTPDLSCGVYRTVRPLAGVGSPADIPNLYLRDDLLSTGPGSFSLLTVPLVPVDSSFGKPFVAGISDDCSHVIFESDVPLMESSSCTPEFDCPTKLYEWVDGSLRLAGVLPDARPAASSVAGLGAIDHFVSGMLSSDGSRVFFASPGDGNVYMRVDGTTTVQMNASEKTLRESPRSASLWVVSKDGAHAFFITAEGLVDDDDNGSSDLYRFDANAPEGRRLTLLSVDNTVGDAHNALGVLGASADGGSVYFFFAGQLVAGEPRLGSGSGLYRWHEGEITFIGEAAGPDDTIPNGVGASPVFRSLTSRVSPDGAHLLFMTHSDAGFSGRFGFAGYDHGASCTFDTPDGTRCRELYLFSADTQSLVCVSCNPSGAPATADALIDAGVGTGAAGSEVHVTHPLSDDGQRVFFHTREALVPEDSNGHYDVYEYDVSTGTVHLISGGKDPSDSYFMDATASGDGAFFVTRQRLVGWDTDQNYDLYDARVGGGLPDPTPAAPGCAGESCQGQPAPGPALEAPASSSYTGPEQTKPHHKHKRRHKKRCTHKRKHRCTPHTHAKHASTHRGTVSASPVVVEID